jgi:hypothetical protein
VTEFRWRLSSESRYAETDLSHLNYLAWKEFSARRRKPRCRRRKIRRNFNASYAQAEFEVALKTICGFNLPTHDEHSETIGRLL